MKSARAGMYPAISLDSWESNEGLGGSSVAEKDTTLNYNCFKRHLYYKQTPIISFNIVEWFLFVFICLKNKINQTITSSVHVVYLSGQSVINQRLQGLLSPWWQTQTATLKEQQIKTKQISCRKDGLTDNNKSNLSQTQLTAKLNTGDCT